MQHKSNTGHAPARVRRLTDSEARDLGFKMIERLSCRTRQSSVVARVMRAINAMRHQTAGAVDAATTLARLSPENARRLTATASEIVHGRDQEGAQ